MQFDAYHKLKAAKDYAEIESSGFIPSTPADYHWLGAGIYFFLNPNGHYWAARWPMRDDKLHYDNIVETKLNPDYYIDFTDSSVVNRLMTIINNIKFAAKAKGESTSDGATIKFMLEHDILSFDGKAPQMIKANFDKNLEPYRVEGSRIFTHDVPDNINTFPQVQACVIDKEIIGALGLAKPPVKGE